MGRPRSRAMILASPMAAPPPAATRPSALAFRAAASPASATPLGTCITACACSAAAREPRTSTIRPPRRTPLPGVAITSARVKPSRAASSATRAIAPGAKTTRWGATSWMKDAVTGAGPSVRAGVLAPDAERLLRGSVGDREQHRILRGVVRVLLPRRHHEHVPRTPFQHLAVDRGRALAFGANEHGAVGRAVALALEALREHREVRAHGRQHRPAVDRIGVAHPRAMALVDITGLHHAFDDRAGAGIGVVD